MHQPVLDALELTVVGALDGGERGARLVRTTSGELRVLKVFGAERADRLRMAMKMTGHLRAQGASVPHPFAPSWRAVAG